MPVIYFLISRAVYKKEQSYNLDLTPANSAWVKKSMHIFGEFHDWCLLEPLQHHFILNCSHKCTVSRILITNICFQKHIVAANWSPCRRQTLRPAASWSQPAGSSNSVPTLCLSHTSTHSPSRHPAVHTWQTLQRLAKEDLYLVFDLLEFASILVKERAWLWGRERSQRSQVFL